MLKKLVTVLLMLVLILSTAYAAPLPEGSDDIPIEPQYTHISSISVRAYLRHNTTVTLLDGASQTNGFYHVTGWSYTSRTDLTTGADRTGYASAAYII